MKVYPVNCRTKETEEIIKKYNEIIWEERRIENDFFRSLFEARPELIGKESFKLFFDSESGEEILTPPPLGKSCIEIIRRKK